ncbi:DUF6522 family protein [Phaeovulum sp.]|uniref:DUF6522 family protein n=1 Tax=Phaeovulum sp. TaxID=2934796 RepID=UPI003566B10E
MTPVERKAEDFVIDAALLAEAFGLPQSEIKARMREGAITSRCEAGVAEDAGRWRLTFHHADRACRFIVDASGNALTRATFPIKTRPQDPKAPHGDGKVAPSDGVAAP